MVDLDHPAANAVAPPSGTLPADPAPPTIPVAPLTLPPPMAAPSARGEDPVMESRHATPPVSGLGAAALLASGVLGAVGVRRRRRLRAADPNARVAAPSASATRVEQQLRRLGGGDRIARLDVGLRAGAAALVEAQPGASILGALLDPFGRLDILLTGRAPNPPAPWRAVTEHRWMLAADVELEALADRARQVNQPCPAMAQIGSIVDGPESTDLFVDLEVVGLLTIHGPPLVRTAIVRAIAAGLAVSPLAEIAHVITCGIDAPSLGHPSMQSAETLDAALDLAASSIGITASVATGSLTTFALRARRQGGEAWEPAIVIAAEASDAQAMDDRELTQIAVPGGRGLGVLVDRPVTGARWWLEPGSQQWLLQPLGLELTPIGVSVSEVRQLEELILEAELPLVPPPPGPVVVPVDGAGEGPAPDEPPWALLVRTLGPVEIVGRDERVVEFDRSKGLELVAWLAQHRERSTRVGARTALWESDVRDATFANVVSDARRSLARAVDPPPGEEWIGRTLTEELPLHRLVVTDADLLAERLRAAEGLCPERAISTIQPTLALVRDMPFAASGYLWPDTEGITSQMTLLVTSAATVLAGHYLALGDIAGVFWATGQGLKALPGHEELIALRMRAHGRRGDLAGVRSEWESYERVLHAESWGDGEPAPKLVALRRELLSLRS
jgi:hypothetical protein